MVLRLLHPPCQLLETARAHMTCVNWDTAPSTLGIGWKAGWIGVPYEVGVMISILQMK